MKKFICSFVLMLLCSNVFAADWVQVANKRWIDKASLNYSNGNITFWLKDLEKYNINRDVENIYKQKIWYSLSQQEIACKNRTSRTLSVTLYNLNDEVIDSWYSPQAEFTPIIPDTHTEFYYKIWCNK